MTDGLDGARLVESVRGALVDGHVEALVALERSAAAVRHHTEELSKSVGAAVGTATQQLAQLVAAAVAEVRNEVDSDQRSLATAIEDAATELNLHIEKALDRATEQARATAATLQDAASDAVERIRKAQAESEQSAAGVVAAMAAERERWQQVIADADSSAERSVAAMVGAITKQADLMDHLAAGFALDVHELHKKWDARDSRRSAKDEMRTEALVKSIAGALESATAQLREETAVLARRDEELERKRAEQFVRVLEDVLSRSGVSGRRLRTRLVGSVERETKETP
jgi:hypothetical protein